MKIHDILREYSNYYKSDYNELNPEIPIGLCAGEDEYVDITLQPSIHWEEDEDQHGHRIVVPEILDVIINEPFTFLGKQYKKGQPFPGELTTYMCGIGNGPMDVGDFGNIFHNLPEKAFKDLQKVYSSGRAGDSNREMKSAVWVHKYLKPQTKNDVNNAREFLRRVEKRSQIFQDYVMQHLKNG